MGYFEGLTNGNFKKDEAGNTVFFPWGFIGRGRVLPDAQTETRVRRFVSRYYKVSLSMIIGVGAIGGWIWTLPLVPLFGAWFYFGSKALISDLPYSETNLTLKEGYENSASGHNKSTLCFLFISSILFVIAGIFVASTASSLRGVIVGWSSVVFFGACGVAIGFMLKAKHNA